MSCDTATETKRANTRINQRLKGENQAYMQTGI